MAYSDSKGIPNLKNKFWSPYTPTPIGLFFMLENLHSGVG